MYHMIHIAYASLWIPLNRHPGQALLSRSMPRPTRERGSTEAQTIDFKGKLSLSEKTKEGRDATLGR